MGHVVDADREYRLLQRQMDRAPTGAPASPALTRILSMLYSSEEAKLAARLPMRPASLADLARCCEIPEAELLDKLTELAVRGLVLDVEVKGQRYFALAAVLGGIFEFIFMRAREDAPMAELAVLFDEYMNRDERFARASYQGETQFSRAFVREEALPTTDHTEILDWERVSYLVETASALSVGLCPCRHKNEHLGKSCGKPLRTCVSLNAGAETMIHSGISERIAAPEALRIIEECKAAGLAQTGDNVQQGVTFICNCCGCCCTLVQAMKTFNLRHVIVSSNWIRDVDTARCTGCGACVRSCPVDAIETSNGGRRPTVATRQEALCLGCGVCQTACTSGATRMKPRAQRVFTPENAFDKTVHMAIERGKLAGIVFENPERLSHRALGRILGILEKTPPWKAAMAVKPLRSAYLNAFIKKASR